MKSNFFTPHPHSTISSVLVFLKPTTASQTTFKTNQSTHHPDQTFNFKPTIELKLFSETKPNLYTLALDLTKALLYEMGTSNLDQTHQPILLMDLPISVLDLIISHLDQIARLEAQSIREERSKSLVMIKGPGRKSWHLTCLHQHHYPPSPIILNSIQSFSVVNRELHRLCGRWLWKVNELFS